MTEPIIQRGTSKTIEVNGYLHHIREVERGYGHGHAQPCYRGMLGWALYKVTKIKTL